MGAIILGPRITSDWEPGKPENQGLGGLLDATHVGLAREIAQGIHLLKDILPRYGFRDEADPLWHRVRDHAEFQRYLAEAVREWNSADSTAKRIKVKAQASVEASIPELHALIHADRAPLNHRVEAFKMMARLGEVGESHGGAGKGGDGKGFSVTINIGKDNQVRLSSAPERRVIDAVVDSEATSESADRIMLNVLDGAGV